MMRHLVFLWDNLGPLHIDRIDACVRHFGDTHTVSAIEMCGQSDVYGWRTGDRGKFEIETVFAGENLSDLSFWRLAPALIRAVRADKGTDYVLCHWNIPAVFMLACWLRLKGRRVFTMGCSKFDDKPRRITKEWLKSLMFLPYNGALGSGKRGRDYFRFMGLSADKIAGEYNTVCLDRIRENADFGPFSEASPEEGPDFETRSFLCVARLVEKKNLFRLLDAYARYVSTATTPRRLDICGSGPLEDALRSHAMELGIADRVNFLGFVQTEEISCMMSRALALLLPSAEEQFGNVVPEALAFGLPILISDAAGARDHLVKSGRNGFVVEPDNREGMAYFMSQLSSDENHWTNMRRAGLSLAPLADVAAFADGVARLLKSERG